MYFESDRVCLFVCSSFGKTMYIQYKKSTNNSTIKDNYTKRNRFTQINNQIIKPGWPIKLAKLCQLISNGVPKLIELGLNKKKK